MPEKKDLDQDEIADSPHGDSSGVRQSRYRKNKKHIGLVRKEIWVYPELWPTIKSLIDKIQSKGKK